MKRLYKISLAFIASAFLLACSTPYYGYTKEDWDNLTEQERINIKDEYRAILATKNNQAHADKIDTRKQSIINYGIEKQEL